LEWDPLSAQKRGADAFLVQLLFIERLSAQPKAIDFAVAVHRLTSLRRVIFPSVRPLDQRKMIAARAAASSFIAPRANDATGLARARSIQDDNPVAAPLKRWPLNGAKRDQSGTLTNGCRRMTPTPTISLRGPKNFEAGLSDGRPHCSKAL
jgi:hypothetical protein